MTTSLCAGQAEAAAPPLIPQAPRRLRGRPSGLKGRCAIAGATGLRPALDPGDLCGPWTAEGAGQATEQPAPAALARRSAQARGHPVDSGARRHEAEATSTGPERISPWPTSRPRGNRASTEPGAVQKPHQKVMPRCQRTPVRRRRHASRRCRWLRRSGRRWSRCPASRHRVARHGPGRPRIGCPRPAAHTWRHIARELGRIHQVTLAGPAGRVQHTTRISPDQAALFTAAEVPFPPKMTGTQPAE
jgi:hypothetical protein